MRNDSSLKRWFRLDSLGRVGRQAPSSTERGAFYQAIRPVDATQTGSVPDHSAERLSSAGSARRLTALKTFFMSMSFRSTLLVIAALNASTVAPAQVSKEAEPLIAAGSSVMPTDVVFQPIDASAAIPVAIDPLAPIDAPKAEAPVVLEEEPVVSSGASLGDKVAQLRGSTPGSRQLECLAVGIYFESKSEPLEGQLAVGHVIANRANSGRFPSSYCGVLFQRGQFSFVRGQSYPSIARSSRQWHNAVAVAKIVDQELHRSPVGKALFFHAKRVSPRWRLTRVGSVGNHVFYR
jgi:N-acetylmuramoyl-L-alanine amidase